MHEKLTELHHLLRDATNKGSLLRALATDQKIAELVNEILLTFGLPVNKGFEEILLEVGRTENLSDDVIDTVLIKLADAEVYYQTLSNLEEKTGDSVK